MQFEFTLWTVLTSVMLSGVYAGFYWLCAQSENRLRGAFWWAFAVQLCISFFNSAIHDVFALKILLHFVFSLALLRTVFRTRLFRAVLLVLLCFGGQIFAERIGVSVVFALSPEMPAATGGWLMNAALCISNAAVLLCMGWIVRSAALCGSRKELGQLLLLCTLFFLIEVALLMLFSSPSLPDVSPLLRGYLALGVLFCLAANALAVWLLVCSAMLNRVRLENIILREQAERQLAHYADFAAYQDQTRIMRHDIMNHLQTIRTLVEQNGTQQARQLAQSLADRYASASSLDRCENRLVDAILHEKLDKMKECGLSCRVDVRIRADIPVDPATLSSVFCNLLDNAIEAAQSAGDPRPIECSAVQSEAALCIRVVNPYSATPQSRPSRPDGVAHGTGSRILHMAAEKYGGSYTQEQQDGLWIAQCVLFYMQKHKD